MSADLAPDLAALRSSLAEGILSENEFRGETTVNLSLAALPEACLLYTSDAADDM
jgi:hypothetical protein